MSEFIRMCRCGNPTFENYPVCGLAICLATDAYNRGAAAAKKLQPKTKKQNEQEGLRHD